MAEWSLWRFAADLYTCCYYHCPDGHRCACGYRTYSCRIGSARPTSATTTPGAWCLKSANGLVPVAGSALAAIGCAHGRIWFRDLRSWRLDDGGRQYPWADPCLDDSNCP